jgi:hypothetical protein
MADPTKPSKPAGSYAVGYKKPPTEHQFKSKQPGDSPQKIKRARKESVQDIAGLFDKPLQVKRGGKTIAVHPYEAELMSLGKRALKGEPRATKLFLKRCEIAGLLDPAPAEQTHGVLVIPKGVNWTITRVLLETHGLPPWDPNAYAALEAEYERDQALIEELYKQFMEDLKNERQT